jgi:hypothetical protein
MAHDLFAEPNNYDPDTLRLLGQAYDEVWQNIAGSYGTAATIGTRAYAWR